jgi:uncharacterized protein YqhQ
MEDVSEKPAFHLGGQALIEGVLMRSPHYVAAAVRRANGSIETRVEPFQSILTKHKWLQIPLLRGTIALFEMLLLGMRYLHWSSHIAMEDSNALVDGTASTPATSEAELVKTDLTGAVASVLSTPVSTTKHTAQKGSHGDSDT